MTTSTLSIRLKLLENYLFEVDFGEFGNLVTDLPSPLGGGEGPNPEQLLAAAVGNCLAASLLFAVRKRKGDPGSITADVRLTVAKPEGRLRVVGIDVALALDAAGALPEIEHVLAQFEQFCTVTESVRAGIPVSVSVTDAAGRPLTSG